MPRQCSYDNHEIKRRRPLGPLGPPGPARRPPRPRHSANHNAPREHQDTATNFAASTVRFRTMPHMLFPKVGLRVGSGPRPNCFPQALGRFRRMPKINFFQVLPRFKVFEAKKRYVVIDSESGSPVTGRTRCEEHNASAKCAQRHNGSPSPGNSFPGAPRGYPNQFCLH